MALAHNLTQHDGVGWGEDRTANQGHSEAEFEQYHPYDGPKADDGQRPRAGYKEGGEGGSSTWLHLQDPKPAA